MNQQSTPTHVLILGCGDVGSQLGLELVRQGIKVTGVRRQAEQLPTEFHRISIDLTSLEQQNKLPEADIIIYCAAATKHDESGYQAAYWQGIKHVLATIQHWRVKPAHVFFTSSTAVYHQNDHSWVDETSSTRPERFNGQIMLATEELLTASDYHSSVIRFSGIYGPGRERLLQAVRQGKGAKAEPLCYSNRIHRDDCVGILLHLIQRVIQGLPLKPVYLASDHYPCPLAEVTEWLATQMRVDVSDKSMGRMSGSKRCENRLIVSEGYTFKYPDFRSGYTAMLPMLWLKP